MADWTPPEASGGWAPPEATAWAPPEAPQAAKATQPSFMGGLSRDLKTGLGNVASVADLFLGIPGQALSVGADIGGRISAVIHGGSRSDAEWAGKATQGYVPEALLHPLTKTMEAFGLGPEYTGKDVDKVMGKITDLIGKTGEEVQKVTKGLLTKADVESLANTAMFAAGAKASGHALDPRLEALAKVKVPKAEAAPPKESKAAAKMVEWAAKADEPLPEKPPKAPKGQSPIAEAALELFEPQPKPSGIPYAAIGLAAGTGVAVAAMTGDDSKGALAALPFAALMSRAEMHVPPELRPIYDRVRIGDIDALPHLDRLRMEMQERGAPEATLKELDLATRELEKAHHEAFGGFAIISPVPLSKKDVEDFGALPLIGLMRMSEAAPLRSFYDHMRYTTGAFSALAKELGNRHVLTKEQIEGVLGRQGVTQAEKELFRGIVGDRASITAKELAVGFKTATGDFELTPKETQTFADYGLFAIGRDATPPSAGVSPEILKEIPVARTTIYQSPIDLGTANHFSDPNYFAHTRSFEEEGVRHVVELQSDVAQKAGKELTKEERAGLEGELARNEEWAHSIGDQTVGLSINDPSWLERKKQSLANTPENMRELLGTILGSRLSLLRGRTGSEALDFALRAADAEDPAMRQRVRRELNAAVIDVLEPFRVKAAEIRAKLAEMEGVGKVRPMLKDWWKRIVREEVAQASQQGESRVARFATADTVAKVEGWPSLADEWRQNAQYYREGSPEYEAAMAKARDPEKQRFRSEHQSIYDRYRRDIEKFLRSEYKARDYTDPHGHTWLEVNLPKAEKPISMFGQGGAGRTELMLGLAAGLGAAVVAKQLSPESDWSSALAASVGGAALAALAPRYARYVAKDWKAAMNDSIGVLGAGLVVGTLQQDPVAGALVSFALGAWKMQPKSVKAPLVKSVEDVANLFEWGSRRYERQAAQFGEGIRQMVPDAVRREAVLRAIDKGDLSGLSSTEQQAAKAWQGLSKELAREADRLGLFKGNELVENYVTHLVEQAGGGAKQLKKVLEKLRTGGAQASEWSPFTQARKFKFLEDLEKAGIPVQKDLALVAEAYLRSMGRAIESKKMLNGLKALKDEKGLGAAIRKDKLAPSEWTVVDSPYLRGYRVHPEAAPHVKWFLEARTPGQAAAAALALNQALKRMSVSYSLFHAYNLGVAHVGARGVFGVSDLARAALGKAGVGGGGPMEAALRQFYEKGLGDTVDEGLRGGLELSPMEEAGVGMGQQFARAIDGMIGMKALEPVSKIAGAGQKAFDRITWGYVHPASKVLVFTREFERELARLGKRGPVTPEMRQQVGRQVAQYVNSVYGHIDWYKMATEATTPAGRWLGMQMLSPRGRVFLQAAMFAPDWTISTFRAMMKALPSAERPIGSLEWRLHAGYALRTGLMLLTLHNALNTMFSGHSIFDPQQKDPFRLDMGDGTEMQLFKHATEAFEWARDPWKTASNKMAYIPREVISQIAKEAWPGGPPMALAPRSDPTTGERAKHVLQGVAPYWMQPMFDPSFTFAEAARKGGAGLLGANIYRMTEDQKARAREARKRELEQRR